MSMNALSGITVTTELPVPILKEDTIVTVYKDGQEIAALKVCQKICNPILHLYNNTYTYTIHFLPHQCKRLVLVIH